MSVVSIVGARPQYIKLAPLHSELQKLKIKHQVINTGQHYDYRMAGVFFEDLQLPKPNIDLEVGSDEAGIMTAKILRGCTKALRKLKPTLAIVYGDTNSTLGGALAAAQAGIPLVHVEAGLRCHDMRVAEELNRAITDRVSNYLMAPTDDAIKNLKSEGITGRIWKTGDLLYDVVRRSLPPEAKQREILTDLGLISQKFILITLHRSDSVDDREKLSRLVQMLAQIGEPALFPIHPRTAKRLRHFGLTKKLHMNKNIRVCQPTGYHEMLSLAANARVIATDSGGLQREAYFLKTPCLLLREVTEWVEIVKSRGSMVVGFDLQRFKRGMHKQRFNFSNRSLCLAGASHRIARHLADILTGL